MRGKLAWKLKLAAALRLIPAHAGKTSWVLVLYAVTMAHPRSCGENSYAATIAAMFMGSSPLIRGKQRAVCAACGQRGLIPAHSGKTADARTVNELFGAHPRSCGENPASTGGKGCPSGSSPLMQGKLPVLRRQLPGPGLIPAHAGKTSVRTIGARL